MNKSKVIRDDNGKQCTKCMMYKTWDQYSPHNSSKDGLKTWCKACNSYYTVNWYHKRKSRNKGELIDPLRVCLTCGQEKTLSSFYVRSGYYDRSCKKCMCKKQNELYRRGNSEDRIVLKKRKTPYRGDDGKECTRCGEIKPWDTFNKKINSIDGVQSWCSYCSHKRYLERKEEKKNQEKKPKEWKLNISELGKRCIHCGVLKAYDEFYKKTKSKDGYQEWCKECTYGSQLRSIERRKKMKFKGVKEVPNMTVRKETPVPKKEIVNRKGVESVEETSFLFGLFRRKKVRYH